MKPDPLQDDQDLVMAFGSVHVDVSPRPGHQDELRRVLLARLQGTASRTPSRPVRLRRLRLNRVLPAVAALVLVGLGCWMFLGGGARAASADLAAVLQKVRDARSVIYDCTIQNEGRPAARTQFFMAQPGRLRTVSSDRINIFDGVSQIHLVLTPDKKKANLVRLKGGDFSYDFLERLRRLHAANGRFLRKDVLDDRQVLVYEVDQDYLITIWVGEQDELPVRVEVRRPDMPGHPLVEVMDHFTWNSDLDPALFSTELPPGYTLTLKDGPIDENALVDLLRIHARLSQGVFPAELVRMDIVNAIYHDAVGRNPGSESEAVKDGVFVHRTTEFDDEAKKAYWQSMRGLQFIEDCREKGFWHYVGGGVRLGDGTAVVCWWGQTGSDAVRVLYGDLSLRTVPADQMASPPDSPAPVR